MSEPGQAVRYQAVVTSPLPGAPYLGLCVYKGKLQAIDLLRAPHRSFVSEDQGVAEAVSWLLDYFRHIEAADRRTFQPEGTDFQQRVWQRLCDIPKGRVMRYGELAGELDSSPRAVAGACRANPIPILIPCHRVIAASGLGGYMGETAGPALAIKQWLLHHEGYV